MLEELKSRPNYKWLILAVSMLTFGSANMGTQVLSPLRGKIAADVAMTETQMGMLTSAYVIAGIFLPILLSMVYRRAPIKKIVIAGGLLMSAGFLAFSFASDYRGLIIARFISGIGSVVFLTASPVIASYAFRDGGLGFAMGIYGIAPCLFSLITLNVFGRFASWRTAIRVVSCFTFLVVAAIVLFLDKNTGNYSSEKKSEGGKKDKGEPLGFEVWKLAIMSMTMGATTLMYVTYAPGLYTEMGYSEQTALFVTSLYMGLNIFFTAIVGKILDKNRDYKRTISAAGLLILGIADFLLASAFIPGKIVLGVLMGVITTAPPIAMFSMYAEVCPPDKMTTGTCIVSFLQNVGQYLGPVAGGMLLDAGKGYPSVFYLMAALLACGALTIYTVKFRPQTGK